MSAETFGAIVRRCRFAVGLSQNALARCAGIDPAYVNRLERGIQGGGGMPSRRVVMALADVLEVRVDDRERLLVAAGHCPEVIIQAGGWDAYRERLRTHMDVAVLALESAFRADAASSDDADGGVMPFMRKTS